LIGFISRRVSSVSSLRLLMVINSDFAKYSDPNYLLNIEFN